MVMNLTYIDSSNTNTITKTGTVDNILNSPYNRMNYTTFCNGSYYGLVAGDGFDSTFILMLQRLAQSSSFSNLSALSTFE